MAKSIKEMLTSQQLSEFCTANGLGEKHAQLTMPDGTVVSGTIDCEAENVAGVAPNDGASASSAEDSQDDVSSNSQDDGEDDGLDQEGDDSGSPGSGGGDNSGDGGGDNGGSDGGDDNGGGDN
ncbi:MAG TPA: hypothetical protein VHA07_00475 [Devosia sp.]|nr:hypothetical protein [Devosia sp.]